MEWKVFTYPVCDLFSRHRVLVQQALEHGSIDVAANCKTSSSPIMRIVQNL